MRADHFVTYTHVFVVAVLLAGCSSGSDNPTANAQNQGTTGAVVTPTDQQTTGPLTNAPVDTDVDTDATGEQTDQNAQLPSQGIVVDPGLMVDQTGSLVSDLPFITDDSFAATEPPQVEPVPAATPAPDTVIENDPSNVFVPETPVTTPDMLEEAAPVDDITPIQDVSVVNPFILDGTPRGTPPIPSAAPEDCILAVAGDGAIFCYSPATRTLRSWGSTSNPWWSFELPGDNDTNIIRGLQVIDQRLMLLAEIRVPGLDRRLEVSVFSTGGQFDRSISWWTDNTDLELVTHSLSTATLDGDLIVVADRVQYTNNILPNANNGVQINRLNIPDEGISIFTSTFNDVRQTNPVLTVAGSEDDGSEDQLLLEFDHQVRAYDTTFQLSDDSSGSYQSIPYTRQNYLQKKSRLTGLIESPPVQQLAAKVEAAYAELRAQAGTVQVIGAGAPFNCPAGGTAQLVFFSTGLTQVFEYTFEDCISDDLIVTGTFSENISNFCGRDCRGPQLTFSFNDFSASFSEGDTWSVQGTLTRNQGSTNLNPVTGNFVNDEIVTYENATDIESLTLNDNGVLLQIDGATYRYNGIARDGTGSWIGSGSLLLRDNSTESFEMDMTRILEDGVQTQLTGFIEGRRSDGTTLRVEAGGEDDEQLLYTVSAGAESISIVNDW